MGSQRAGPAVPETSLHGSPCGLFAFRQHDRPTKHRQDRGSGTAGTFGGLEPEKLPEGRMHPPVASLPLLPNPASGVNKQRGCCLRQSGLLAGLTDCSGCWIARRARSPGAVGAVGVVGHSSYPYWRWSALNARYQRRATASRFSGVAVSMFPLNPPPAPI